MATVKINVCVEESTKQVAEQLLAEMGLTMTAAINMYLKRIIMEQGIPFDVTTRVPNATTVAALEEGDRILSDPNRVSYKSIAELKAAVEDEI